MLVTTNNSLDAFSLRTEEEFYQALALEVLKVSASRMDLLLENARKFMGRFIPLITFSAENQNEVYLSLNWNEVKKESTDILNMAEKYSQRKRVEIHNLYFLPVSLLFWIRCTIYWLKTDYFKIRTVKKPKFRVWI